MWNSDDLEDIPFGVDPMDMSLWPRRVREYQAFMGRPLILADNVKSGCVHIEFRICEFVNPKRML